MIQDKPKVILVYPRSEGALTGLRRMRPLPLGLLSSSVYLTDRYNVSIFDQNLYHNWKKKLRDELTPDTIAVGVYAQAQGSFLYHSLEISKFIKSVSSLPVIWGGVFPSIAPEVVLQEDCVDYVCIREGEITLPEFLDAVSSGRNPENVAGLGYRENGQFVFTQDRPFVDLNEVPDLPYDLVPVHRYDGGFAWRKRKGDFKLQLESSRGCRRNCSFCYHALYSRRKWRSQSAEKVLERIDRLVIDYRATHIDFIDDSFFTDKDRIEKMALGLLSKKYKVRWLVQGTEVDTVVNLDDDYLKLIESAGCRNLRLGAESGSAKVLSTIQKRSSAEQLIEANRKLSKYNIAPWYYLSVGAKGETQEDLRQTIDMLFQLLEENPRARLATTFCLTPLPGTKLFDEAVQEGYVPPKTVSEYAKVDGSTIVSPWFTDREKRDRAFLSFLGYFIDKKNREAMDSIIVRLIAELYRPLAVYRTGHLSLDFPLEYKAYQLLQKIRR